MNSERPKILISLAAWTLGKSGGDVHALEMGKNWSSVADVHFLCPNGAKSLVAEYVPKATVHTFGDFGSAQSTLSQVVDYLRRISSIRRNVQASGPFDVIVGASHFLPDVTALMFGNTKTRAMYVYHLSSFRSRGVSVRSVIAIWAEQISLLIARSTKPLVFVSNREMQNRLNRWKEVRYTVLGFDVLKFSQTPEQSRDIDVLYAARVIKAKGYEDFLKCINELVHSSLVLRKIVLIGTGPDVNDLLSKISDYDLGPYVDYLGFVDEAQKIQLMKSSYVVLAPSYEEGWGIAIGEALAAGAVPVAYELDVLRELFPEGLQLLPLGEWELLTRKVQQLLEDKTYWKNCSDKGRDDVQRYHNDKIAELEYECLLSRFNDES
jgi:glycosyltransferase involved in cell wall biosynthesis